MRRAAHALKGAVANFAASEAQQAAQRLEDAIRAGDRTGIGPLVDRLENVVDTLVNELKEFTKPSQVLS